MLEVERDRHPFWLAALLCWSWASCLLSLNLFDIASQSLWSNDPSDGPARVVPYIKLAVQCDRRPQTSIVVAYNKPEHSLEEQEARRHESSGS